MVSALNEELEKMKDWGKIKGSECTWYYKPVANKDMFDLSEKFQLTSLTASLNNID